MTPLRVRGARPDQTTDKALTAVLSLTQPLDYAVRRRAAYALLVSQAACRHPWFMEKLLYKAMQGQQLYKQKRKKKARVADTATAQQTKQTRVEALRSGG